MRVMRFKRCRECGKELLTALFHYLPNIETEQEVCRFCMLPPEPPNTLLGLPIVYKDDDESLRFNQ